MADENERGIVTDVLTLRQALDAMVMFLEEYYRQTSSDDVGGLLSELPAVGIKGTRSGDPAAWPDWLIAVERAVAAKTPGWQESIDRLIADPANFVGRSASEAKWYARVLPDGRQLWARVYHGALQGAGCNSVPRPFDPDAGLSAADYK